MSLTFYTCQSKFDFSFLGAGLFAVTWVLLLWGGVTAIMGVQPGLMYSVLGAIVFSLYILYDTSQILYRHSVDDYVVASIDLYLDIVNLFLFLLRLLSQRD